MVLLYMALTADHARQEYSFAEPLTRVSLQGRFRVSNGAWQAYPPQDMDVLRTVGEETVEFTGHTLADIPQGRNIFMYVRHVRASLAVNGTTVFSVGGNNSQPSFTRTPGSFWGSIISPGITPKDTLSIVMQRVAGDSHPYQLELFLGNIHQGSVWELLKTELLKAWWAPPLVGLFLVMSFLLVFLSILFALHKERKLALQAAFLAGTYICMSLWAAVGYEVLSLIIPYPTAIIVWETFSILFSGIFIILYIATLLTGIRRTLAHCSVLLLTVYFATPVLQLTGHIELFAFQTYLHRFTLCIFGACICLAFMEGRRADKETMQAFLTFIPLPIMGSLDLIVCAFGPVTNGFFSCVGFLITEVLQIFLLMQTAYKKMRQSSRLERELMESRVAIALSQVRPHFLYNILTGIQYLCAKDPSRAERAVTNFTMFLRGNLNSLSSAEPIPLAQELKHVRHYLALEQLRYGDKLKVEWDLEDVNFTVPALSVQPLAENAIRWGLRENGLTVRIVTRVTPSGHVIRVEDDGLGFDPLSDQPPRGNGIGLNSIRTRVHDSYGGSLHIDSKPGEGTVVSLHFPPKTHLRHA